MTCRHNPGDPSCSSNHAYSPSPSMPPTPNASEYSVEEIVEEGRHVVMKVHYPNCARCSYEGMKIMVFLDVSLKDVIRWRKIDPHFRDRRDQRAPGAREAPSPSARFPGDADGWQDAILYARRKN